MNQSIWLLDPTIHFLNHGSFGATPIPVLDYQTQLRREIEGNPVQFFAEKLESLLDNAREKLALFVGADSRELAFVPNATTGVNAVLRSLVWNPRDEILITNHTYNACRNAVEFLAKRSQVKIITATIPFPLASAEEIINAVIEKVSPQTKLVLLDHITSQTALIWPVERLVKELETRGIDTLIDGAHVPGVLPLNLRSLGVAYYTGNCHKWLCAPKGSAFLYVREDKQNGIRPLTISHGANSPRQERSLFHLEFDWMGTDDPTAYLCVPKAIEVMNSLLGGGWQELRERNRNLALAARELLCQRLDVPLPCPDAMIGAMASIPLKNFSLTGEALQTRLKEDYQIEVPIVPWYSQQWFVRISAQFYNRLEQYQVLADALCRFRD